MKCIKVHCSFKSNLIKFARWRMTSEVKRISSRTPKPNLRYLKDHDEVLDDVKVKEKSKAVVVKADKTLVQKSRGPSNVNILDGTLKATEKSKAVVNADETLLQKSRGPSNVNISDGALKAKEKSTAVVNADETLVQKSRGPSNVNVLECHQKGRVCTRQELRPKLTGTVFEINCQEMAESALEEFNMTVADLDTFLHENMKIKKGNKVTTKKGHWKIMVNCKKVSNDKDGFNKKYLKYLIKMYLWRRGIRDWVHVDAKSPSSLKLLYYRNAGNVE